MRNTIIMGGIAAVAIVAVIVGLRRPREIAEPLAPPTQQVAVVRKPVLPAAAPESPTGEPTQAQRDLAQIEQSPAKDTPEAKQIAALLEKYGWDRAALPAAYAYAYQRQHMLRMMGTNLNEGERGFVEAALRNHRERLERYGPLTETFMEDLSAIRPTVFFGQRNTDGETLQ